MELKFLPTLCPYFDDTFNLCSTVITSLNICTKKAARSFYYCISKSMYGKRSKNLLLSLLWIYVRKKEKEVTTIASSNLYMTKGVKIYCYHFSKSMYEKRSKKLLLFCLQIFVRKKEQKSTAITSLNLCTKKEQEVTMHLQIYVQKKKQKSTTITSLNICTKKGARSYYYCFFKSIYEKTIKNLLLSLL